MTSETKSESQSPSHKDASAWSIQKEERNLPSRNLSAANVLNITNNFGIEVEEVGFIEFDRRKNTIREASVFKFERRGFLENLENLIRDLDRK